MGIDFEIPAAIAGQLGDMAFDYCLAAPLRAGLCIEYIAEALNPGGSARYVGLKIAKAK